MQNVADRQIEENVCLLLNKDRLSPAKIEESVCRMGLESVLSDTDVERIAEVVSTQRVSERSRTLFEELAAVAIRSRLYQIEHSRCLPYMQRLPSRCLDLIVTSPPYNIRIDCGEEVCDELPWPQYYAWMNNVIAECYRLLRTGGTLALIVPAFVRWQRDHAHGNTWEDYDASFSTNHSQRKDKVYGKGRIERVGMKLSDLMLELSPYQREMIVWVKAAAGIPVAKTHQMGSDSDPHFRPVSELILLGSKDRWYHRGGTGRRGDGVLPYKDWLKDAWLIPPANSNEGHPAPFPIEIPRRLIAIFTHTDDAIIFDPFSGRGTTQEAAAEAGLPWLGCDAVEKWAKSSTERLRMIEAQGRLFPLNGHEKGKQSAFAQVELPLFAQQN